MKSHRSLIIALGAAVVVVGIVVALIVNNNSNSRFRRFSIDSDSMLNILTDGDSVKVDTEYYDNHKIQRGDIVAYKIRSTHQAELCFGPRDGHLIQRVIALPNDAITIEYGLVIVNGKKVKEPYTLPSRNVGETDIPNTKIPPSNVWIMGDNRISTTKDSRCAGPIPESAIVGKVVKILENPSNTQNVDNSCDPVDILLCGTGE